MKAARQKRRNYFQFRHRLASGEVRDVEVHSNTVVIDGKKYLYSSCTTLPSASRRSKNYKKAKSAFLATMSHEIRTPLNAVIGMAALLEQTPLNEQQKDHARTILDSSDALLSLINDILDYSKIEAGRLELENAPFDLSDVITGPLTIMAGKASEKAIELTYTNDAETPATLIGDSARLRQVKRRSRDPGRYRGQG